MCSWFIAALASFGTGYLVPLVNRRVCVYIARFGMPHHQGGIFTVLAAMLLAYGLGSAVLIFISWLVPDRAMAIVVAFMAGIGLGQWWRRKL